MLSPETVRFGFRVDDMDDVRLIPDTEDEGSESSAPLRDGEGFCEEFGVRADLDRRGGSVGEGFAVDVSMFASRAPCL